MRKGLLSCAFYFIGLYTIVFAILPLLIDGAEHMGSLQKREAAMFRNSMRRFANQEQYYRQRRSIRRWNKQ